MIFDSAVLYAPMQNCKRPQTARSALERSPHFPSRARIQKKSKTHPSPSKHSPLTILPTLPSPLQTHIMASRTISRALRSPLAKQLSAPARRTFVSAINASARPMAARAVASAQQVRGVKTIDFAGVKEDVYGLLIELNGCKQ